MATVLYGAIGFTVTILALVVVLLAAKRRLVLSGEVQIAINDDPDHSLTTIKSASRRWRPSIRTPPC